MRFLKQSRLAAANGRHCRMSLGDMITDKTRGAESRASRRMTDVKWGLRRGAAMVVLMFVPALLYALAAPPREVADNLLLLSRWFIPYLIFGAAAGAVTGRYRSFARTLLGSALTGAGIGAVGITALVVLGNIGRRNITHTLIIACVALGIVLGSFLGVWLRWRFRWRAAKVGAPGTGSHRAHEG